MIEEMSNAAEDFKTIIREGMPQNILIIGKILSVAAENDSLSMNDDLVVEAQAENVKCADNMKTFEGMILEMIDAEILMPLPLVNFMNETYENNSINVDSKKK
jgi:hypothetical protein